VVFRKQIYCIEESTRDILGTFRLPPLSFGAPIVIWRPGNCAPHRYAPGKVSASQLEGWVFDPQPLSELP